ncbi:hypothetical protein QWY85_19920 [Neolewinella lacunae]|uniref:Tetratricopeptide repeat protein n=1 Tax=Neolewinella lacunae TaxID=1517758 RepID=A0A923T944_9BACT|nr:hypothetical protein [Neolewinella lacunae]MBC6996325.1 hypothetical protein [Neolewinella lacunae]MDN3636948.1 hypothetical protein [Neolewinella lacunae]
MNAKDFQNYLEKPRLLFGLPLTELQQLALRYPYSANLRLLLWVKAHLEGHPDEATYRERCAAATFDRSFLYDLLRELTEDAHQAPLGEGETLELKNLEELSLDALLAPSPNENRPASATPPPPPPAAAAVWPPEELDFPAPKVPKNPTPVVPPPLPGFDVAAWVAAAATFTTLLPAPAPSLAPAAEGELQPEPSQKFARQTTPPSPPSLRQRLHRIREMQDIRPRSGGAAVDSIARRSLMAQEDVASETLASLLVRQGQYQNAIKMYQRLILLNPDKKPIFAGLIQDLKEKL